LFKETWKEKVTPAGRRYLEHTASVPRTSGNDCGSWPTARSTEGEKNVRTLEGSLREIERKGGPQDLNQAACLASWVTPRVSDGKDGNLCREGRAKGVSMSEQAQLTASGEMLTGSSAGTVSGGQLNPALSRWLLGLPPEWCEAAIQASRSMRTTPRKRGSKD
jgi:hypothetical protein